MVALPSPRGLVCMAGSGGKDTRASAVSSEASFIDPVLAAVLGETAEQHNVGRLHSACKLLPSWGRGRRLLTKNTVLRATLEEQDPPGLASDQFSLPLAHHRHVRVEVEGSLVTPSQVQL